MKASIYSHKQLIGTTELKVGDEGMNSLYGNFEPTEFYFNTVQNVVWDFWETNKPDYKKWNSLRINVQLENGYFLFPIGGYTIDDIKKLPNEPKRIDIAGVDNHIIEDYFQKKEQPIFIDEPWKKITIDGKILFEDELYKEVGLLDNSIFDKIKVGFRKHNLADYEFSALANYRCNDDVLFAINKKGFDKKFAVIHLTWKGKRELDNCPSPDFFENFERFKTERMYPDKLEWDKETY